MAFHQSALERTTAPRTAPDMTPCMLRDLRIYQIDDLSYNAAKMADLIKQSLGEGFELLQRIDQHWNSGVRRYDRAGEALFCAEHEGRIVALCGRVQDPVEKETLQLRHGYVLPEWRQLGIGSAVMKRVTDVPADLYRRVAMRAYFQPVRRFCERHGFQAIDHPRYTHELLIQSL